MYFLMNNQFQLKHCVFQNIANAFLKYSDIQNLKNFKNALRISIIAAYKCQCLIVLGMFAWHFISSWYGFVCLTCLQQWLIRLNQFQCVLRNIFIFEIPKISITHWHCKLGMSAEANLPLILVNCNFNTKRYLLICSWLGQTFQKVTGISDT